MRENIMFWVVLIGLLWLGSGAISSGLYFGTVMKHPKFGLAKVSAAMKKSRWMVLSGPFGGFYIVWHALRDLNPVGFSLPTMANCRKRFPNDREWVFKRFAREEGSRAQLPRFLPDRKK